MVLSLNPLSVELGLWGRLTGQKRPLLGGAAFVGPERRRPEVLDAALKLFLESGYEGTSMQAVADEAG